MFIAGFMRQPLKNTNDRMDLNSKNTVKKTLTLLCLSVFLIALLVKPIHIAIEHSGPITVNGFHHDKVLFVPDHHFDCQVCEFEFCVFIFQTAIVIPSVQIFTIKDKAAELVAGLPFSIYSCLQLRAPPAI